MSLEEDKKLIEINDCNDSEYTILDCRGTEIKASTSLLKQNSEYFNSLFSRWNNESLKKNKDGYPIVYLSYDSQTIHSLLDELNPCNVKDFLCIKKEEKQDNRKKHKIFHTSKFSYSEFTMKNYKICDDKLVDFGCNLRFHYERKFHSGFSLGRDTTEPYFGKCLTVTFYKCQNEEKIICAFRDSKNKGQEFESEDFQNLLLFEENLKQIGKDEIFQKVKERCKEIFEQYFYEIVGEHVEKL
jgi:hypothetical protein